MWWFTPVILALGRLKQEDLEFEASLATQGEPISKNQNKQTKIPSSQVQWCMPVVIPTTQGAEAGGSLEPRSSRIA
jgi:hypothetical protein